MKKFISVFAAALIALPALGQIAEKPFTHADTLRGSITPERSWWDVQRYDISVTPDFADKFTAGKNVITYKVVEKDHPAKMQIDLMKPLKIDSIVYDGNQKLNYSREGSAFHVDVNKQDYESTHKIAVYFSGHPQVAKNPPWDGGWSFKKDDKGRPWMTVSCQGLGASVWFPNKDHQSEEPDKGASLTMRVPDDLMGVSNGRLLNKEEHDDGTTSYKWGVENPINNYTIIPYIGHYKNFSQEYTGLKGDLDLNYWVMDYNLEKAKNYLPEQTHNMLDAFEHWFGPYPFYEDGYKLVEAPHAGMEHQSGIAYGNYFKTGYRGRDVSHTGVGYLWDFIIVHESGHEWFGNNITGNDLADMWVQESFTNYSETLFTEYNFGKKAANDYIFGTRQNIQNDTPIIPDYGVNAEGSGDMYYKGGNMLHSIRHSMNDDELFRSILTGLNKHFYHQTVDTEEIQDYFSKKAGFDYSAVFKQYLTTTSIPDLELQIDREEHQLHYRYNNCVDGFNLPLVMTGKDKTLKLKPTEKWQTIDLPTDSDYLLAPRRIEYRYYLNVKINSK